jgi:hypothetical protein
VPGIEALDKMLLILITPVNELEIIGRIFYISSFDKPEDLFVLTETGFFPFVDQVFV